MLTLIVNPVAGSGYALRVERELTAALEARHLAFRLLHTEAPGHAAQLAQQAAAQADCTGVVAVGGDGTAYEVACGLMGTQVPLGIIPAGTGNDFIKTVGLPKKPLAALDFILTHEARPVDVGGLNGHLFLNVCGTGFDVMVLENTLAAKKYLRGILPYLIGLLRAIVHYHPVRVRCMVDGEEEQEREVLICSVANGRYIGGGIPICPDAQPDDGMLDVLLVDNVPRWKLPFYLPGLLMGHVLRFHITHHRRCSSVRLRGEGMRVNIDGEIATLDAADFTLKPGVLLLYWPGEKVAEPAGIARAVGE